MFQSNDYAYANTMYKMIMLTIHGNNFTGIMT